MKGLGKIELLPSVKVKESSYLRAVVYLHVQIPVKANLNLARSGDEKTA